MNFTRFLIAGVLFVASPAFAVVPPESQDTPLQNLAFGSCNHQGLGKKFWWNIARIQPDAWIWLGDVIYGDLFTPAMRAKAYRRVKNAPGYRELVSKSYILGTWDDHDYGFDNSNSSFGGKEISKQLFLDFLDEPAGSQRRKQPGIHAAYRFGPPGRLLKIILLDQRYFRENEGENADILGEDQWQWLATELARDDAELTLIGSSSQILPWGGKGEESWVLYPRSRERLLDLLRRTPGKHLILSGDRHFSEISQIPLGDGRMLVDFTSSGLTHAHGLFFRKDRNPLRVGKRMVKRNFGMLRFDWTRTPVGVTLEQWGTCGKLFDSMELP
jgi:alkaline phosphatase D